MTYSYLGDFLSFNSGKSVKAQDEGAYPVYGSNGIIGYTEEPLYENSIILGRVGAYCGSVMYSKSPFWASDNTIVATVKQKETDTRFTYYLLSTLQLNKYSKGSAQPLITQTILNNIKTHFPPLEIQKKIADILGAYDELIENNRRQITLLEEVAQRLYKEWFIDLRFPGHETTPIDPTTNLPHTWKEEKLDELFSIQTGKKDANYSTEDGEFTFFTCAQEPIKAPDYSFDTSAIILAGNGDLYTRLFRGKFEAYQRTYVLEPNKHDFLYTGFCAVDTNLSILKAGANGSTIKYLTKGMIQNIKIPIPTSDILDRFNKFFSDIQAQKEHLETETKDAQEARDRLLPKLMSGELEVTA